MDPLSKAPNATPFDARPALATPFFITSITKMCLLYIATMGAYTLYWYYKQWTCQRRYRGENISPVWRSVFPMLFTHSLCARVARHLPATPQSPWRWRWLATGVVALMVYQLIIVLANTPHLPQQWRVAWGFGFLATGDLLILLGFIQHRINLACHDPKGASNSRLSPGNWIWLVVGVGMWAVRIWEIRQFSQAGYSVW